VKDALELIGIGGLCAALLLSSCEKAAPPPPPAAPPAAKPAPKPTPPPEPPAPKPTLTTTPPAANPTPPPAKTVPLPPDLVAFKADIGKATAQIDLAVASVESLAASTGDLEKPHENFVAAMTALDTGTQAVRKRADDMREKGAAYFEAWEKSVASMSSPEAKEIADKRRTELATKYADLLTAMQETRAAYDTLAAGLQSIEKKLDEDLTEDNLKLIAPQAAKAKEDAKTVKDRAAATLTKLDDVAAIYSRS
jgi:Protein of unknown function (DUF2959)